MYDDPKWVAGHLHYQPHVPGKVIISRRFFAVLCILSLLGVFTLFFILAGA